MANMITRPIASAAERTAASTYLWGHAGSGPATDRRFAATDLVFKDGSGNYGFGDAAGSGYKTDVRLHAVASGVVGYVRWGSNSDQYATRLESRIDGSGFPSTTLFGPKDGNGTFRIGIGATDQERLRIFGANGHIAPGADNAQNLGSGSLRMAVIYAGTGSINTSDEREKTWRGALTEPEYAAGRAIFAELGFYQWTDEVERKGAEKARFHFGARAQQVWKICAAHNLAPKIKANGKPESGIVPPAFLCFDEWDEETEPEYEDAEVEVDEEEIVATGKFVEVEGKDYELTEAVMRKVMRMERRATGRNVVRLKGGYRYGFRVDELNSFLIAVQSRRQGELEARIAAMEPAP